MWLQLCSSRDDLHRACCVDQTWPNLAVTGAGPVENTLPPNTDTPLTFTVRNDGPGAAIPTLPLASPAPYTIRLSVTSKPAGSTVTLAPVSISNAAYTSPVAAAASLVYTLAGSPPTVPPGSNVVIVVNVRSDLPGPVVVTAKADDNDAVAEADKTDNVFILALNVLPVRGNGCDSGHAAGLWKPPCLIL